MMRTCPTCGRHFPEDTNFCPADGTLLTKREKDPAIGTVLMGQFELQELCGSGSMGTVYRAWQTTMGREVAVKILQRDLMGNIGIVKRFHREARAAARLSHPNIITVYLVGETAEGLPFLVMEYVRGQSLGALCEQSAPLPPARAVAIAQQIASALIEAHAHDIIHRDLKPANIIVTQRQAMPELVKVLDFGIAKILGDGDSYVTQTGAIFGTPHFLSPEQASGTPVDARCDLYSLGVILFGLATGKLPFNSDSDSGMEVIVKHLKDPPPRPRDLVPSIPQSLEEVIMRALEKDRERRWQSAQQLLDALQTVAAQLSGGSGEDRLPAAARGSGAPMLVPLERTIQPTWRSEWTTPPPSGPTEGLGDLDLSASPMAETLDPRLARTPGSGSAWRPASRRRVGGVTGRMKKRVLQRPPTARMLVLSITAVATGAAATAYWLGHLDPLQTPPAAGAAVDRAPASRTDAPPPHRPQPPRRAAPPPVRTVPPHAGTEVDASGADAATPLDTGVQQAPESKPERKRRWRPRRRPRRRPPRVRPQPVVPAPSYPTEPAPPPAPVIPPLGPDPMEAAPAPEESAPSAEPAPPPEPDVPAQDEDHELPNDSPAPPPPPDEELDQPI